MQRRVNDATGVNRQPGLGELPTEADSAFATADDAALNNPLSRDAVVREMTGMGDDVVSATADDFAGAADDFAAAADDFAGGADDFAQAEDWMHQNEPFYHVNEAANAADDVAAAADDFAGGADDFAQAEDWMHQNEPFYHVNEVANNPASVPQGPVVSATSQYTPEQTYREALDDWIASGRPNSVEKWDYLMAAYDDIPQDAHLPEVFNPKHSAIGTEPGIIDDPTKGIIQKLTEV